MAKYDIEALSSELKQKIQSVKDSVTDARTAVLLQATELAVSVKTSLTDNFQQMGQQMDNTAKDLQTAQAEAMTKQKAEITTVMNEKTGEITGYLDNDFGPFLLDQLKNVAIKANDEQYVTDSFKWQIDKYQLW